MIGLNKMSRTKILIGSNEFWELDDDALLSIIQHGNLNMDFYLIILFKNTLNSSTIILSRVKTMAR
uniref:Uncharacterized protein n=1 Tax=Rhizophagus irregularis (strain DAOM 181602 / DAOM 197198 / MUCL 43194) TaxID=747089 RepID=U9U4T3_RHIID